ncbi:MAG: precorrin-6y C5,15-methyltransferase (decarboxylating) subunit CbiE [Thermodesulfovibrionales bacterium]|nr:precorrin-6y C5,15-methyltransferase (decarboxylating) subunit CbiE [Thermodesulfovibrionales bacterium]
MQKLYVIGVGYKPLDNYSKGVIEKADFILTSGRIFELFNQTDSYQRVKEKVKVINNVDDTIEFIRSNYFKTDNIVLLASGDPLFYGIGKRAIEEFGKESVEIIPDLSSIQVAFAKIKESWEDAFLMSLHGGPDPSKRRHLLYDITDLPSLIKIHRKILILTDKKNNPSEIAKELVSSGFSGELRLYVCERLGYPDERIIMGSPHDIWGRDYSYPNLVIILNDSIDRVESPLKEGEIVFGLSEDELYHTAGLVTKDEVRAVVIHKLRLPKRGVFWDIGAGSGSISFESAGVSPFLKIYTIEKNIDQIQHIKNNLRKFFTKNIELVEGEAPEVLRNLPPPHRVFIGGSGGKIEEIVQFAANSLAQIIVINATKLETLYRSINSLKVLNYEVDVVQVSISKMKALGMGNFLSANNPVFVIRGIKQ